MLISCISLKEEVVDIHCIPWRAFTCQQIDWLGLNWRQWSGVRCRYIRANGRGVLMFYWGVLMVYQGKIEFFAWFRNIGNSCLMMVMATARLGSPPKPRERMEIQIFNKLSWMVPGLVDRIVNSGPAEAMDLADLVCSCGLSSYHSLIFERFKRVWQAQGLMIPKV